MHTKPTAKYLKDYLPPSHQVDNFDLKVDLHPTQTVIKAQAEYTALDGSNELVLDGVELTLRSVKVNGQLFTDYEVTDERLTLRGLPDKFTLEVTNEISPSTNTSLEGLYQSQGAYCTQCEAEGFRKITYFLDRPDVLTSYDVTITAPQSIPYLLSNGNKIEEGQLADGRHYAKWQDPHKKPSYLFALVAGDFDVLEDTFKTQSGRDVKLALYVDKGNLHKAPHAISSLKHAMKWDETRFNLEYDLDIYMIVAVDFFNMGAMENKGLNIFNSACVLASQDTATDRDYHTIESIVGHEYFHNWTGNRVTCRDWFQLSLKEGLTVFRDQEFSSDLGSRALNRIDAVMAMRTHQFAEDAGPMAHPIRPEMVIEMNNFYTVTVYNKGAEVIRMMHTLLGETAFQAGMKLYFERHDGQAVTCDDFVQAMNDASGVDLTQFKRWYSQIGTPTVQVNTDFDEASKTYKLTLTQQHADNDPVTEPLHIPFAIELLADDGNSLPLNIDGKPVNQVLELTDLTQSYVFEGVESEPTAVLLENFSAPCIVNYNYTLDQLIHILTFASSDYARWEAVQQAFVLEIKEAVNLVSQSQSVVLSEKLISVLGLLLNETNFDKALLAELLILPSFETLSAHFQTVPVDELVNVINQFEQQLAESLRVEFKHAYENSQEAGEISHDAVAARSLKSVCLFYLAKIDDHQVSDWLTLDATSSNMTLKLSAMKAAVSSTHKLSQQFLSEFDGAWRHDPLVMDKWFALQATSKSDQVIDDVKSLYEHPCFDKANPNRVRALVGSFARNNPSQFHRKDGLGYRLLADLLIELNDINPQNASRMITPLMGWKRFDQQRQDLMKAELVRISKIPNLSPDLFEKVDKAINA